MCYVTKAVQFIFHYSIREGQKKTAYKAKTLNPVFNEIFSFQLEQSRIAETKLRVAVWDHDFFGEDDFNGEAVVDLSRISLNAGTHTDWFMLQLEVNCLGRRGVRGGMWEKRKLEVYVKWN